MEQQLTISQFRELHIDFEKEHRDLLHELEEVLHLFEDFKDLVNDQSLLLDEVEENVVDSQHILSEGNHQLIQVSTIQPTILLMRLPNSVHLLFH